MKRETENDRTTVATRKSDGIRIGNLGGRDRNNLLTFPLARKLGVP